ncbi:SRPBCC family protein [Arachidicoccus sp.]|uniref:SRPBCC family protein n=1 Tax=Arachidicoccus sp. TaxID=1872624 RepID=UPI003D1C1589
MEKNKLISVETVVNLDAAKVWNYWTIPDHIVKWNKASEDWHTTQAKSDLRAGGVFLCRMEAKDGSFGFDFGGVYNEITTNKHIAYTIDDGRKVIIDFAELHGKTKIVETFEAENINSIEQQRQGWQSILDNFKKYAENN